MKRCVALMSVMLLVGCGENKPQEPTTPQEMYEHAKALLKPNVKGDASDFAGALQWTRRAADGGWVPAMLDMGYFYMYGAKGIKPDVAMARAWYEKALAAGSSDAHWFLGTLYYDVPENLRDVNKAMLHWRAAAEFGLADACYRLGRIYAQKPDTLHEGISWLQKATQRGTKGICPQAFTALANIYMTGAHGAPKDEAKAVEYYIRGAGAGDPLAQLVYAELLMEGAAGVAQNREKAMSMLRLSAGQDYPRAIARLIHVLRNSPNADQAEPEAKAWEERLIRLQQQTK